MAKAKPKRITPNTKAKVATSSKSKVAKAAPKKVTPKPDPAFEFVDPPKPIPEPDMAVSAEVKTRRKIFRSFCIDQGKAFCDELPIYEENWRENAWVTMGLAVDCSRIDENGTFVEDIRYLFRIIDGLSIKECTSPEDYSDPDFQDCFCFIYDPGHAVAAALAIDKPCRLVLFREDPSSYVFSKICEGPWIPNLRERFNNYVKNGCKLSNAASTDTDGAGSSPRRLIRN